MGRLKRKEKKQDEIEIPMTPMIDVVFQLLIYFLVTFETPDVMAHLNVFRPQPDATQEKPETPPDIIDVGIYPDGFTIGDRQVTLERLDELLAKLAGYGTGQTVIIKCGLDSSHGDLVRVLDLCAKAGLTNLSVMSE
jgi:biopolymer transport protein ExbD